MFLPSKTIIRDVTLRDGLQSIKRVVPTADKIRWLQGLYAAGFRNLEVASFVPPKYLPQMADAAQVVTAAKNLPGLTVCAVVPNLRGAQNAFAAGADEITFPLSISKAHCLANIKRTPDEAVAAIAAIAEEREKQGVKTRLEVGLCTAFGCTMQGKVSASEVFRLAKAALDAGADCLMLADTVGYGNPRQFHDYCAALESMAPGKLAGVHIHDTRGLGLANSLAALQEGARRFDSCVAGLGGCPFAPNASGNVSTEDLWYLMESMGIATGIDFDALLAVRKDITQVLAGETFWGTIVRAGLPLTMQKQITATADSCGRL